MPWGLSDPSGPPKTTVEISTIFHAYEPFLHPTLFCAFVSITFSTLIHLLGIFKKFINHFNWLTRNSPDIRKLITIPAKLTNQARACNLSLIIFSGKQDPALQALESVLRTEAGAWGARRTVID